MLFLCFGAVVVLEGAIQAAIFFNYDAQFALYLMQIYSKWHKYLNLHYCRKLVQIRNLKGAGTKMHRFLFGLKFKAGYYGKI